MSTFVKIIIASLIVSLIGCGPRGESKSLSEIYERSQKRFEEGMNNASLNDSIKPLLMQVADSTKALINEPSASSTATGLADILSRCGEKASPTTRQPIYELSIQLRAMSEDTNSPSPGERMLIASRVLDAVASELETVGFRG